jgi:2-keto-4-pentenoate hydratase
VSTDRIGAAAALLVEARRTRTTLARLPEHARPRDEAEGVLIQDLVIAGIGGMAGWKTGPAQPGSDPAFTPLPKIDIHASPAALADIRAFRPEVEVEIALRFGKDLPPRPGQPYTADEVIDAIDAVLPAIELIGSRYDDRKAVDTFETVADFRSNLSAVIGGPGKPWREARDFVSVGMTLAYDGKQVAEVPGGPSTAVVLDLATRLAAYAQTRPWPVKHGDVVITGSRIGPLKLPPEARQVTATVDGLGTVSLTVAS